MKKVRFVENADVDYGDGPIYYKEGSVHTMRDDKAQRWINRGKAVLETDYLKIDNPVASAAAVSGADSGDPGKRTVNVAASVPAAAKPAVPGNK